MEKSNAWSHILDTGSLLPAPHFWGYLQYRPPGYYETNTRYFWEANLYDLGNSEMIYSIQTESFDPASTADLA
jgi:hypothetical protein